MSVQAIEYSPLETIRLGGSLRQFGREFRLPFARLLKQLKRCVCRFQALKDFSHTQSPEAWRSRYFEEREISAKKNLIIKVAG